MRLGFFGFWLASWAMAAAWSFAPPALAAEATVIERLTTENVTAVLREWEATDIAESRAQGKDADGTAFELKYLTFIHSGIRYVAFFHACDAAGEGCRGLQVVTAFQASDTPLDVLNAFNHRHRTGKTYRSKNFFASERYIIVDHGVTSRNILVQLAVLESATATLLKHVKEGGVTAGISGPTIPTAFGVAADLTAHTNRPAPDLSSMTINAWPH